MDNLRLSIVLGLATTPLEIIIFGVMIYVLIKDFKNHPGYEPINLAMITAFAGAEVAFVAAFLFDFFSIQHSNYRLLSWYILGNVFSRLIAVIAVPIVLFYKVKK